jgi:glycerophosphoryl diester phosphodiesterase
MKVIIYLFLMIYISNAVKNKATYITANGRALNIAHRGLCSILPENTMEAFESALYLGADFI